MCSDSSLAEVGHPVGKLSRPRAGVQQTRLTLAGRPGRVCDDRGAMNSGR